MAILAVPFALSMGRRGSLTGVAVAIGVAIAYSVVAGTLTRWGTRNMLPAIISLVPDLLLLGAGGYLLLRTPTLIAQISYGLCTLKLKWLKNVSRLRPLFPYMRRYWRGYLWRRVRDSE